MLGICFAVCNGRIIKGIVAAHARMGSGVQNGCLSALVIDYTERYWAA